MGLSGKRGTKRKGMSEGDRLEAFAYEDGALAQRVEKLTLQHLAQLLLSKKTVTEADITKALKHVALHCGVPEADVRRPSPDGIGQVMSRLNTALSDAADLRVATGFDEQRGSIVWCLCNGRADALSLAAVAYTPEQIDALRGLLDWVFVDDRREAGALAALTQQQLNEKFPALSKGVVARMIADGWITEVDKDCPGENCGTVRYSVGSRLMAEMAKYVADTYGDGVRLCVVCELPVLLVCYHQPQGDLVHLYIVLYSFHMNRVIDVSMINAQRECTESVQLVCLLVIQMIHLSVHHAGHYGVDNNNNNYRQHTHTHTRSR